MYIAYLKCYDLLGVSVGVVEDIVEDDDVIDGVEEGTLLMPEGEVKEVELVRNDIELVVGVDEVEIIAKVTIIILIYNKFNIYMN